MAASHPEIELLTGGLSADSPLKGRYLQNFWRRKQADEVRPGLGQQGQFDTTQAYPPSGMFADTSTYGYQEVLGCFAIETDFGHVQVLTLLSCTSFSGSCAPRGVWQTVYALNIWDATTGRRFEEVLHRHTGELDLESNPLINWRACFETNADSDFANWPIAQGPADVNAPPDVSASHGAFFCEYQDAVFFGSPSLGLWAYQPADFIGAIPQTVDAIRSTDFASVRGESSRVFRVPVTVGLFRDAYAYLDTAGFPSPVDAAQISGRLAIAGKQEVFFTDAGRPGSIIGINILPVPCQGKIVAIGEVSANLLIFTDANETFLFQPGTGALLADGNLQKISDSIGCLGPQCKIKAHDELVWADAYGIWASQGQFQIEELSKDFRAFFLEGMSNPLTAYYQNSGKSTLSAVQPKSFYDFNDKSGVNVAYDTPNRMLVVSIPSQGIALTRQDAQWSVWNLESVCQSTNSQVGVQQNLRNLHFATALGRLFAVGGVESYTPNDKTQRGGAPLPHNDKTRSLFIVELAHGGALDRSVDVAEDNRQFAGWYEQVGDPTVTTTFVIDHPQLLPDGYAYLPLTADFTITSAVPTYLFPVLLRPADGYSPDLIQLIFEFDNTQWQPVLSGVTTQVDFTLPPERISSSDGWGWGAPTVGFAEVQVYDSGTGLPTIGGNQIVCNFDGTFGVPWAFQPTMNLSPRCLNPLMFLPFRRKPSAVVAKDTAMSLGINPATLVATIKVGGSPLVPAAVWVWHEPSVLNRHGADDIAQPVDWCHKSAQINAQMVPHNQFNPPKDGDQVKARGMYLRVVSHGKGGSGIFAAWPWGLLNAAIGSDWKDWTSQILDYTGDVSQAAKTPGLRARFKDLAGAAAISGRIFNNPSANPPKFSAIANTAQGNFLVDDEQMDTQAISDSVKGELVSYTLFGHIRDKAEKLVLQSAKAVVENIGGRRRRGR